jgi:hypothetical protein
MPSTTKQTISKGSRRAADLTTAIAVSDPWRQRQAVISRLQVTATETQASVRALLTSQEATGDAANARSFWIFNGLAADANLDAVLALASLPNVKAVRLDRRYHRINHPQLLPQTIPWRVWKDRILEPKWLSDRLLDSA